MHINGLTEALARSLLERMDEHGGVDDFCEKLSGFPEQYATDLAVTAINELEFIIHNALAAKS